MRIVPLSRVLTDLVGYAEEVLRAPQLQTRAPQSFLELCAEVAHRHAQPAEDVRVTRAAVIMVTAIDGFFADKDSSWLMLAGATLPLLREEAWQSALNEKNARTLEMAEGSRR